ncbi:MAG: response regulator [Candidatus Omnitrophica bacterium]|nr:response regulator [Candidatus Omnitrophota bacterium]MDD5236123.1 response regulator [Candidatus Omnitrophota bacterium]MDD5611212.1 response regulator [Candidatus Omnitrophota bacterium]
MAEKILLVDDDSDFREELREALKDYDILEAGNGKQALNILARANEVAVVILDMFMSGLSGIDVLKWIKKNDQGMGVIMLTGYSSKDSVIDALRGHADDYIEKPPDIKKIKDSIENLLEKKRHEVDVEACDINGKIEKIKRFTMRNCFKKISLSDAAGVVCLSPKYLSRSFKNVAGVSFSQFKIKIKIDAAKKLLRNTGYNINQISDKLGYGNAETFTRQFKKLTRYSPTEFRKKVKVSR